ncbi:MAG: hypothetical protein H6817_00640 [Phycisphaerales bacterium]|nr:hypothetical protein [Phycisphaerales bacterium]
MLKRATFLLFLVTGVSVPSAHAVIRLPAIIGDNMVLQRETTVPIWGWSQPNADVTIQTDWRSEPWTTHADAKGEWRVEIDTPEAGGPYRMVFSDESTHTTLEDVMIGEVWMCSGQSNMEWAMQYGIEFGDGERANARYPQIRLFHAAKSMSATPLPDNAGKWEACNPKTVYSFSAVAYFFGRDLHDELDVPIGLIECAWGGTKAEPWTSAAALHELKIYDDELAEVEAAAASPQNLAEQYRQAIAQWWKSLDDLDAAAGRSQWSQPEFDDSTWDTLDVPQPWSKSPLADFDGVAVFRRQFEVPDSWTDAGCVLELGPIDDMDTTWINGTQVGATTELNKWTTPRSYHMPAGVLKPGTNTIAVRIVDTIGDGGFCGKAHDLRLHETGAAGDGISLAGKWRYQRGAAISDLPPFPRERIHANAPTVLFNGMIAPVIPFAIRGAIWYQGESNCSLADQYAALFSRMITDWRERWGRGDFPFYFVQIAPFDYHTPTPIAAELRDAQRLSLKTPNTGMVVTLDIGNPNDIHPRNKRDVGRRLSLWALANTYGREGITYSGPLFRDAKADGNRVIVSFDYVAQGLVASEPLTGFEVAGADGKFAPAAAAIEGDKVIVTSESVPEPKAVRYGWSNTFAAKLFNTAKLPASSFTATIGQ